MSFKGGPYIVHLFDSYTVAPSILFVAFLEVIAVMYAYGKLIFEIGKALWIFIK